MSVISVPSAKKKSEAVSIALRAQDHHEGLRNLTIDPIAEVEYTNTLLIGKAATLAMHLKGLLYVQDYRALRYSAAQLGLRANDLEPVLRELEELDFIRIVRAGTSFKRLEVKVPQLRDGYDELGTRWKDLEPTEVEQASIALLTEVTAVPHRESQLLKKLGIDRKAYALSSDILRSTALMERYESPGEDPVLYSPLMIEGDPRALVKLLNKYRETDLSSAFEKVESYQGLHLSSPKISNDPVVNEALLTGILQPTTIDTAAGKTERFLFTPRGGLEPEETVILDKARAIMACVRAGQHFAAHRPIFSPRAILNTLRNRKRFKRGHPDLQIQYGTLVAKQIGAVVEDGNGNFNFEVHDTPENLKAFDIAIDMLELGEAPSAKLDLEAQKSLLDATSYSGPVSTRTVVAKGMKRSKTSQIWIIQELTKLARGIRSE